MDELQKHIQKIELDTVRAVTKLEGEVKNLTRAVIRLESTVTRMSESYVTKEEYTEDMRNLKRKRWQDGAVLTIVSVVITSLVLYALNDVLGGRL